MIYMVITEYSAGWKWNDCEKEQVVCLGRIVEWAWTRPILKLRTDPIFKFVTLESKMSFKRFLIFRCRSANVVSNAKYERIHVEKSRDWERMQSMQRGGQVLCAVGTEDVIDVKEDREVEQGPVNQEMAVKLRGSLWTWSGYKFSKWLRLRQWRSANSTFWKCINASHRNEKFKLCTRFKF